MYPCLYQNERWTRNAYFKQTHALELSNEQFNWSSPRVFIILYVVCFKSLTHWGRVTHICVSKLTNIGSNNVLSPGRRQAIILTNAGILLIGPLGTNFNEMLIEIHAFSFTKIHLKMSSGKWWPFCLGLNVLTELWILEWAHCGYQISYQPNCYQHTPGRKGTARFHVNAMCWSVFGTTC